AAELDADFLAPERAMERELLAHDVVGLDLEVGALEDRIGTALLADDLGEEVERAQLADAAHLLADIGARRADQERVIALGDGEIVRAVVPAVHDLLHLALAR